MYACVKGRRIRSHVNWKGEGAILPRARALFTLREKFTRVPRKEPEDWGAAA